MSEAAVIPPAALRASDGDRERVVDVLRGHAADGRLTVDELAERIEQAYGARTQRELDELLRDLPATSVVAERDPEAVPARWCAPSDLRPFLAVNLLLIVIWAATGAGYFWPIWPLLGWGIGIASHRGRRGREHGVGHRPRRMLAR